MGSAIVAAAVARPVAQSSTIGLIVILPHFIVASLTIAAQQSGASSCSARGTPALNRLKDFVGNLFLLVRQADVKRFECRD
jgi:hypothetical protein